jgi:two-component system sensor histidine kinase YesM
VQLKIFGITFNKLKKIKFKKIQTEIMLAFTGLIIFTALPISLISYRLNTQSVELNSRDYTMQLIQQVNTNIGYYVSYMDSISQMVVSSGDIRDYLTRPSFSSNAEKEALEGKILDQLNSTISVRKDISNIIIFGNDGRVILNKNLTLNPYVDYHSQAWYKLAVESGGKPVISSSYVQNIINNDYSWVVSLSREIIGSDGKTNLGVMLVDLNYSVINNMCSKINLGKRGYIFIVDDKGNIVYHPQQQLIYSNLKTEMISRVMSAKSNYFITNEGSDSRIYTITKSSTTGWKLIGVSYINELVTNKGMMQAYYIFYGLALFLIAIVISMLISSGISKPIKYLETTMKEVEKGNLDIRVDINSENEIGELSKSFNIMTSKIKNLMQLNLREQAQKQKSEIRALQSQINPHFLYNTLDSIIWMAESGKNEEVVKMTSALAKLFRISISKGEELIPLCTEIEHIRNYLTIQKMRYNDKLDYEINVEDEILNYKVIKIILQPIVENAIYHGIKTMQGAGMVKITGKLLDGKILLKVVDNGVGMTKEDLERIFEVKIKTKPTAGSNVGVKNVNERIKLYFGDEYGLSFESKRYEGTVVSILLPVLDSEEGNSL